MQTLSLTCSSFSSYKKNLSIKSVNSRRNSASCRASPQLNQLNKQQLFTGIGYDNPLRVPMMNKTGRRSGVVCYSSPIAPQNLQLISAVCAAVLMLAKGTAIPKPFLVPLFALQAPANIVSWMKGEYGIWSAFLALLVRLFFFIPGELELPFITLLLVIVSPYQIMRLRGTQEGVILSLIIAAYLAFQHFTRAGSLGKSFDQGSILATLATICAVVVPCLLLI